MVVRSVPQARLAVTVFGQMQGYGAEGEYKQDGTKVSISVADGSLESTYDDEELKIK